MVSKNLYIHTCIYTYICTRIHPQGGALGLLQLVHSERSRMSKAVLGSADKLIHIYPCTHIHTYTHIHTGRGSRSAATSTLREIKNEQSSSRKRGQTFFCRHVGAQKIGGKHNGRGGSDQGGEIGARKGARQRVFIPRTPFVGVVCLCMVWQRSRRRKWCRKRSVFVCMYA